MPALPGGLPVPREETGRKMGKPWRGKRKAGKTTERGKEDQKTTCLFSEGHFK